MKNFYKSKESGSYTLSLNQIQQLRDDLRSKILDEKIDEMIKTYQGQTPTGDMKAMNLAKDISIRVGVKEIEHHLFKFEYGKLLDQLFKGTSPLRNSFDHQLHEMYRSGDITRPTNAEITKANNFHKKCLSFLTCRPDPERTSLFVPMNVKGSESKEGKTHSG